MIYVSLQMLILSQGLSDFCVDPNKHVEKAAAKNGPAEAGNAHVTFTSWLFVHA